MFLAVYFGVWYCEYLAPYAVFLFYTSRKTSAVSTTVSMVETQLCKLRGTSGTFVFIKLGLFVHAAVRGGTCAFTLKMSTRWSKTAHATIGLRSRHRSNPRPTRFVSGKAGECRWRPRRYQVDPWSRGREVARGVQRSSPKQLSYMIRYETHSN